MFFEWFHQWSSAGQRPAARTGKYQHITTEKRTSQIPNAVSITILEGAGVDLIERAVLPPVQWYDLRGSSWLVAVGQHCPGDAD